jgi:hypothetical protein
LLSVPEQREEPVTTWLVSTTTLPSRTGTARRGRTHADDRGLVG